MAGRLPGNKEHASRTKILEAAIEAFSLNGYDGTSIRDISKICEFQQPTIYHFFKNKENLFWVALRSTHLMTMRMIRLRLVRDKNLRLELYSIFRAMEELHEANPGPAFLIFRLVYSSPLPIRDRFVSRHGDDYRNLIKDAFSHFGPVENSEIKCGMLVHLMQSRHLILSTLKRNGKLSAEQSAFDYETYIDFVLAGA